MSSNHQMYDEFAATNVLKAKAYTPIGNTGFYFGNVKLLEGVQEIHLDIYPLGGGASVMKVALIAQKYYKPHLPANQRWYWCAPVGYDWKDIQNHPPLPQIAEVVAYIYELFLGPQPVQAEVSPEGAWSIF